MRPEHDAGDRRAATVIAGMTARRAARTGAVWGVLFGALAAYDALGYHTSFPSVAARAHLEQTFGGNTGLAAVIGPARQLDTAGGWVAWRTFGLLVIVGAIWGMLTATRLMRREEDTGRWELLLAGQTTRHRAAVQAIAGLAAGWAAAWALTAGILAAAGASRDVSFPVTASLFYATAANASAAMFLAIGALASQLSPARRQANGLAAGVFAAAFVIRMAADAGTGLAWMRWASPLGWVENLRPLTAPQPLALLPITALTTAAAWAAADMAGRRDLSAGTLARQRPAKTSTRLLGSPVVLVARLERWVGLAWIGGLGLLALMFGVVARLAAKGNVGVEQMEQAVARLGGHAGGAAAWLGYEFVFIAALAAYAAAGQISALRGEEADGLLDNLLARPVSRATWLAGHLGFAAALIILIELAAGLGGWIGVAARDSGVGLAAMVQAGLNVAVPGLFIIGVGTLLFGLIPRLAGPILYALILWSFLIQIIGSTVTVSHWLLDTAVLTHLGPVPATSLNWTAIAWLTGLGVLAALAGLAAFSHRDLAAA